MPGEIDKDLVTAVKAARGGKPMQFAFVPKGQEGVLFVAKKVPPKKVAELKKEVGANLAFVGRLVVGEDGKLVFEVAKEPPPTLMPQLRKRLKEDAGLTLPLDVCVAADAEAEGPEGDGDESVPTAPPPPTTGTAPPPAPDAVADWKAKLAEWSPAIKAAIAAKHPKAEQIQKFLQDAAGMAKPGGDYVSAILRLKAAFTLASGTAPPPTAPQTPAPGGPGTIPPPPDAAADWKAKLAEWSPAIKKAIAEKHPKADQIQKFLQDAAGMAKPGGDYVAAILRLKAAVTLAGGPAPTAAPSGPPSFAAWTAARTEALAKLKDIAKEIAAAKHADSTKAIIELNAVMKNLTAEPGTKQQVAELERYLNQDDVVLDVSELADDIRTPLLKALADLKPQLAA